jgi:hypothetical protein
MILLLHMWSSQDLSINHKDTKTLRNGKEKIGAVAH